MKKYRLLKDLPFAKAGAEVGVELAISVRGKDNFLTWIGDPKDLESLIDEGWIEEVKPREFEVTLNKNGSLVKFFNGKDRFTYTNQPLCDYPPFETIKVREVLE